ncbi:hypothetical protein AN4745.2 [Aspergillus nidulans FGSC A4]|uniref:Rho GTPase activator (Rgd1) n=1 Tax=Emericella nidulans (strain FGSC A4 / ATCC 38163 / CBS 112.46 / NRRL 194 / M139) TaxID=227321 RepID=Q5B3Y5_EMENI|nr:hypothetical protein [Aspergillus nidulans FGSC A4]EAA60787.1 hypothetical protein AN4745.2 [Aspergillus nidulans FGSC A4]CBF76878.1 TPA: hypothetical protein similar to Rho GTPase activating protein (Eurofung) [Aspergillus nidulans FGSC A4]|eukprot:XP_662349.1 hypothetical protein AN4745.2 [Aspergillus nidulans FGSC A4]
MADPTLHDGPAPNTPSSGDQGVPPLSAGSGAPSASGLEARAGAPVVSEELKARLDKVIYSDIGVATLLTRLKQSIASARDFASFLKKRSILEEEHAQGLRKVSRALYDAAHKSENRQGTYSYGCVEINGFHDRMADHGLQFAASLQQMADNLNELAGNIERGRKQWKHEGLSAEKRVLEAEALAEKAKSKYDTLAEQYDRVKTGEKAGGKFGFKGTKSVAQQEEDLLRKVQSADSDYKAKVQAAQTARQELISTHRPQAVHNIQQLISECDSGLALQMQKFGTFNEKLLLGQGLSISPLKEPGEGAAAPKSLREVIQQIDNQKDYHDYILSHEFNPGAVTSEQIQYHRHPTLGGPTAPPVSSPQSTQTKRQSVVVPQPVYQPPTSTQAPQIPIQIPSSGPLESPQSAPYPQNPDVFAPPPFQPPYPTASGPPPEPQPLNQPQPPAPKEPYPAPGSGYLPNLNLPPLKPVFGVSLNELYARDGTAVPMIVYQCFQAVELFGLDVEGIYRLSGSATHISQMKALFDNDSSQVDFTNPESFNHDVNSVAGLLKQFFRDLPDPLFTSQAYSSFIDAARIDDDIQRRDSLHAIINGLPDAHYATLRALILHLNKVQEHYTQNRMNAGNIAICFGPTLMGASSGGNIADAGWQVRVIETILENTFQIFDDD